MKRLVILAATASLLAACAEQQQAQQVTVSPLEFKKYSCKQIAKEMAYTSAKRDKLTTQDDGSSAVLNTALMAYMVSQRYAFTSHEATDPQVDYLNARYDALHQAAIEKNCD